MQLQDTSCLKKSRMRGVHRIGTRIGQEGSCERARRRPNPMMLLEATSCLARNPRLLVLLRKARHNFNKDPNSARPATRVTLWSRPPLARSGGHRNTRLVFSPKGSLHNIPSGCQSIRACTHEFATSVLGTLVTLRNPHWCRRSHRPLAGVCCSPRGRRQSPLAVDVPWTLA